MKGLFFSRTSLPIKIIFYATAILAFHFHTPSMAEVNARQTGLIKNTGTNTTSLAFTTAVQFPQPLVIGLQAAKENTPDWVAFIQGGFFKYPFSGSSRSFSNYTIETGVRVHPFSDGFYVTGEVGFRHIGINVDISNLKQDGVALANTAVGSIGTFYLGLLAGWEWGISGSFSIAMDLGIQLALLHAGSVTINPLEDDGTNYRVEDDREMSRISGLPLPQIALFRLICRL